MASSKSADRANAKRTKLLDDDSDASSSADEAVLPLTVNKEYAARFEYNKKREERQRLEEKYGDSATNKRKRLQGDISDSDDDSTDEEEDDDAELATADVDEEIFATLNAIKNKDPKVYDASVKFFREFDPEAAAATSGSKKAEKPMYLSDYHRANILAKGDGDMEVDEEDAPVQTYQQEQDALKQQLVGAMHAANDAQDGEDDFLVAKSKSRHESMPLPKRKKITEKDIETADADPETFLSNFMVARAWLPGEGSGPAPFESDDSDDDARADEFEEAYNMRFENPQVSNEKLQSFARDVGKYGARREAKTGRQLAREREKERKDAAKREREEDKARLRKLKIEEAEEKVKKIKEAAGLRGEELDIRQWREVLEDDFDDESWETEMKRRFGEDYYAQDDNGVDADEEAGDEKKRKVKKPKWDDDIDIEDILPDFDAGEKPTVTLSSDDEEDDGGVEVPKKKSKTSASDAKRAARKERRRIEEIVDAALPVHLVGEDSSAPGKPSGFRYRETSPTTFGLSARDILFADDSQLNEFAGLKKMAAFRDEEKKRRDKKKFSKKARLKKWRKDTFGTDVEPTGGFERIFGGEEAAPASKSADGEAGKKKRKHKKSKTAKTEAA